MKLLFLFFALIYARDTLTKYILFDVKVGEGFNLQKSVFVRVAHMVAFLNEETKPCQECDGQDCAEFCVSYTIVLPPWCFLAHWANLAFIYEGTPRIGWSEFFDLDAMRTVVPIIEFDEYEAKFGWKVDHVTTARFWDFVFDKREGNQRQHKTVSWDKCFKNRELAEIKDGIRIDFSGHCGTMIAKTGSCVANYAYQPSDLGPPMVEAAGEFTSILIKNADNFGIPFTNWWKYREIMVFSSEIRMTADRWIADNFGNQDYIALHLRRSDFLRAHPDYVASPNAVGKRIAFLKKKYNTRNIFVMTDARKEEREEIRNADPSIRFFEEEVQHPGKLAMIEQWIGVRALHFEGTQESRFSFAIWEERDRFEKNEDNKWWMMCKWYDTGDEECTRKPYNDFQKHKENSQDFLSYYKKVDNLKSEL